MAAADWRHGRMPSRAKNFQRSLQLCPRARCCFAATASRSRRAAAPICTGIRGPASGVCSKAASASTPTAARHPYGPGGAWYETGPDGVFAQAADRPTRFIRVMILPLVYLGKSSVEYLNEEDKAKPKSQQYKIFADMPLVRSPHERSDMRGAIPGCRFAHPGYICSHRLIAALHVDIDQHRRAVLERLADQVGGVLHGRGALRLRCRASAPGRRNRSPDR